MNYISLDKKYIMNTYARYPLAVDSAQVDTVISCDGKKYIDFASGIGTASLGYNNEKWKNAVIDQLDKIQHISNYYVSPVTSLLAKEIITKSQFGEKIFFSNSGAEANECAIKIARKYSFDKYGEGRNVIITLNKSFHGRTITTVSATGQEKFHNYFFPFTEGFRYIDPTIESLNDALKNDVCALMLEPIQGEGGVNILDKAFLKTASELCRKNDILLITDEVQTGVGRTGKFFCFENFDIKPNIVTLAKGLGNGLPIGATITDELTSGVLKFGDHGSTFGGNPVSAAGAYEVVKHLFKKNTLPNICKTGDHIAKQLSSLECDNIIKVDHMGLMIGIKVKNNFKEIANKCFENGLLVLTAGNNTIRLLPPLTIRLSTVDKGLKILKEALTTNYSKE